MKHETKLGRTTLGSAVITLPVLRCITVTVSSAPQNNQQLKSHNKPLRHQRRPEKLSYTYLLLVTPHSHFSLLNRTPTLLYRKHAAKAVLHLRHASQRDLHETYDLFVHRHP